MPQFSRKDNKAMTLHDLLQVVDKAKGLNKPVIMSCDEEGNEMLVLQSVEIAKNGQITLWPMTQY